MKKKSIKIVHLYYDLMNLYGESGNVKAIKKFLERQNVDVEIHFLTVGDKINFSNSDFYYIGAGSEENQRIVLDDLMKYKNDISESIENGKMFLATGNSMELFGKKIRLQSGESITCLGVLDYQAYEQEKRLVSEICYKYDGLPENGGKYILGFRNCSCNIVHNKERMFGFANNINRNNFYAMNFVGPFLIRNPYFTNLLVEKLLVSKGLPYTPITDTVEFKAYHEYVNRFISDNNLD